jgi:hypothetical protein
MENGEKRQLVGAQRKEDGSLDTSKAMWMLPEENKVESHEDEQRLPDDMLEKARRRLRGPLSGKLRTLKFVAKEFDMPEEVLLRQVREYTSELIRSSENGSLRHYHVTGMENFERIAAEGALLSRTKLKERHPDIAIAKWSASEDVMMTRDKYDQEGKLVREGFSNHGVGAMSSRILFVFSEDVMTTENYDAINKYPTASEILLEETCEVILVKTEQDKREAQRVLEENDVDVPVMLREEWSRE